MNHHDATTILRHLQYSPLRLGFACGVYTQGESDPFVSVRNERGTYAGQTDRITTREEWERIFEKKYFPEGQKHHAACPCSGCSKD